MSDRDVERIAAHIHAEELADLALILGNTFSPSGHERPLAEVVHQWFERNGLSAVLQPILPDRANVIARLNGIGGGTSLILNAHLDTEVSGPEYDWGMMQPDINRQGAWREEERLFGHTILNDRGLMAAAMIALKAVRDSGFRLRGDLIFTAVAGETGMAPVDEFQGMTYEGKGVGTRFLVAHGVRADYALVAETTDYGLSWIGCGACYFKVSVPGQSIYTPRSFRPSDLREHPNAIVKMTRVIEQIEQWAREYEARHSFDSPCGRVIPKVVIGAIRGGIPYRPNRTASHCAIYVDVRIVPGEDPLRIHRELEAVVAAAEVGARVQLYLARSGAHGAGVEPLAHEIRRSYRDVLGEDPPATAPSEVVSMWRDINVFNEVGIPALTFGPPRRKEEQTGRLYLDLRDLTATAMIYALTAARLCGHSPPG